MVSHVLGRNKGRPLPTRALKGGNPAKVIEVVPNGSHLRVSRNLCEKDHKGVVSGVLQSGEREELRDGGGPSGKCHCGRLRGRRLEHRGQEAASEHGRFGPIYEAWSRRCSCGSCGRCRCDAKLQHSESGGKMSDRSNDKWCGWVGCGKRGWDENGLGARHLQRSESIINDGISNFNDYLSPKINQGAGEAPVRRATATGRPPKPPPRR